MGKLFKQYIEVRRIYVCRQCKSHITCHKELVSKTFTGQYGRAFLFNITININEGPPEEKALLTGLHIVRDIFCKFCRLLIGWKYDKAYEQDQKYKEGRFIVERNQVSKYEWND